MREGEAGEEKRIIGGRAEKGKEEEYPKRLEHGERKDNNNPNDKEI